MNNSNIKIQSCENIIEEEFLNEIVRSIKSIKDIREKTSPELEVMEKFLDKYQGILIEETKNYEKIQRALYDYSVTPEIYCYGKNLKRTALLEAITLAKTLKFKGVKEETREQIKAIYEKNINRKNNYKNMNLEKIFNGAMTLMEIASGGYQIGGNMARQHDLSGKVLEELNNNKLSKSEGDKVKEIFAYNIMANQLLEYKDVKNYSSLQNRAIERYNQICPTGKEILLKYADKEFLKVK